MIKVGITGQSGFIGIHLANNLLLNKEKYALMPFQDDYFVDNELLENFIRECDVIVHLAAVNRHNDPQYIYNTNIELVEKLIAALESTDSRPTVIMSSSIQEERGNIYGDSKRKGRELLVQWAEKSGANFIGLIMPNVFGPFGVPFYNSVISTFAHQVINNEQPKIEVDAELRLIYVQDLVQTILKYIDQTDSKNVVTAVEVEHIGVSKVSELLAKMLTYKDLYVDKGIFPDLSNYFDVCLFNTFRSYLPAEHFPVKYIKHSDNRGDFVEVIRNISGGQTSYSTTKPGITRGNHFHLRKIERFAVIQGRALIKLRRFGTDEIIEYVVDGNEPSFVDMPIWYTHNIQNIGNEDLVTMFWINEFFDPADPDTYYEEV